VDIPSLPEESFGLSDFIIFFITVVETDFKYMRKWVSK
jgi:hypothetical protein